MAESFPQIETPEVNNSLDMLTFEELIDLDQRGLEENFHFELMQEGSKKSVIDYHFAMLNDRALFVGSGENAIVLKGRGTDKYCVKCRWEYPPMVNNKSKKAQNLPEHLHGLKSVQEYFARVGSKKDKRKRQGIVTSQQFNSLHEALITKKASEALREAGIENCVPEMQFVIKMDYEESGTVKEDAYAASETVYMLYMSKVKGMTLEEMILENNISIREGLDIDTFTSRLKEIVTALHAAGITHNDITLRNVMIDEDTHLPWLIDFGAARYEKPARSQEVHDHDTQSIESVVVRWLKKLLADPQGTSAELKLIKDQQLLA